MRWVALGCGMLLLASPFRSSGFDLYCKGDAYFNSKQVAADFTVSIDEATRRARVWTPDGDGYGIATVEDLLYKGFVFTSSGTSFWFTLNRYTGEIVVLRHAPNEPIQGKTLDFTGTCTKRQKMF